MDLDFWHGRRSLFLIQGRNDGIVLRRDPGVMEDDMEECGEALELSSSN